MMLPSKKVVSLFILTGALVASIVIAFGRDKGSQVINVAQNLVAGEQISLPQNPEWQKELGSVTADIKPALPSSESVSEQTTTDAVSTSLISNYLALKQNDQLNPESAQKLVDQSLEYIEKTADPKIKASDLKIITDNGRQTIAEYGENLGLILKKNKSSGSENEIAIIEEIIKAQDPEKIDELQGAINTYEKIATDLKKMPVPQIFVKAHIDTVNGMLGIVLGLKEVQQVLIDPFRALNGLRIYQEGGTLFTSAIQASSKFITQNNILYKQGSGGYYLLYGI